MNELGFTEQEQSYVTRIAGVKVTSFYRVWFYSALLVPFIAFGIYGLVRGDLIALGLAFTALVFFSIWRIASEIKHAPLFFSIFSKIAEYEKRGGA